VLREDEVQLRTKELRERGVGEGRVLVGVQHVDVVRGGESSDAEGEPTPGADARRPRNVISSSDAAQGPASSRQTTRGSTHGGARRTMSTTRRSVPPGWRLSTTCRTRTRRVGAAGSVARASLTTGR
jgi:hypothetical protein